MQNPMHSHDESSTDEQQLLCFSKHRATFPSMSFHKFGSLITRNHHPSKYILETSSASAPPDFLTTNQTESVPAFPRSQEDLRQDTKIVEQLPTLVAHANVSQEDLRVPNLLGANQKKHNHSRHPKLLTPLEAKGLLIITGLCIDSQFALWEPKSLNITCQAMSAKKWGRKR